MVRRCQQRVSGPVLDRIDLKVDVPGLGEEELVNHPQAEPSRKVRERVCAARTRQNIRFESRKLYCNSQMGSREIKEYCAINDDVKNLLRAAIQQLSLSARAYDRILKVARTIADLKAAEEIMVPHVAEAIQYRSLDRKMGT